MVMVLLPPKAGMTVETNRYLETTDGTTSQTVVATMVPDVFTSHDVEGTHEDTG